MVGTTLLGNFHRLFSASASAPGGTVNNHIELQDLSSPKGAAQPRACEHHAGPDRAKRLVDRVCESISSGLNAALSDLRALFTESKKGPESAGSAAKKPLSQHGDRHGGSIRKARQHPAAPASRYRLATLKEALAKERGRRPTADTFIRRMNHLQYQGRLAGQLEELNLRELRFLWSQASKGSENDLSPEARKTLCEKGHLWLCKAFQAEARHYGRDPAGLERPLPRWAASAPAEWCPRAALRRAYCVE